MAQNGNKEEELLAKINKIPSDGWWRQSTGETFCRTGLRLLKAGLDKDDVLRILTDLYFATSEEFGM